MHTKTITTSSLLTPLFLAGITIAAWDSPIPPVAKAPASLNGAILCSPESQVDRNTTRFQTSDGKTVDIALLGCDFPAEADKNQVSSKDMAGVTAYVVVRSRPATITNNTPRIPSKPTQPSNIGQPNNQPTQSIQGNAASDGQTGSQQGTKPQPTGWLTKTTTQDTSHGYVYVYSQPDDAWVALNFVAAASGLAWMVDPKYWPVHGPEDATMTQAMQRGVEAASAQHLGLYAILDNPKTVAFEDVVQLRDNMDRYWFPDDVRNQFETIITALEANGEFSEIPKTAQNKTLEGRI